MHNAAINIQTGNFTSHANFLLDSPELRHAREIKLISIVPAYAMKRTVNLSPTNSFLHTQYT